MLNKKKFKIPLNEFIDLALYHPRTGYYMKKIPFGKEGDFITAPNISIIFSEMIFLWIISFWKQFYNNKKINIIELGAGNAEMMYQILNSAQKFGNFFENCNFVIYEKSKKLINLQKIKLKKHKVKWINSFNDIENHPTIFLGNEFLDSMPVKQFIKTNDIWYERYVQKKNKDYSFINIKCDIKKLENKLNLKISKRHKFLEISLEEVNIIKKMNKFISKKGGCIFLIDYAYLSHNMFDTLQAVKNHKKVNLFKTVGNTDITHLINIPFLKKISKKLNLELVFNTQREFLLNLGILKRAEICKFSSG